MRRAACSLAILLGIVLQLSSCGTKSISADELRSDIASAISLAGDADTSLRLFRQQRLSSAFFDGHIESLSEEAQRNAQHLRSGSAADSRLEPQLRESRQDLDSLSAALLLVREHYRDRARLAEAGARIVATRKALESLAAAQ